jgi:Lar family restriction alleviation protein
MPMIDRMKPCPFCWSDDLELIDQPCSDEPDPNDPDDKPFRVVTCNRCGADGPVSSTDDVAVDRWNRRDGRLWRTSRVT